MRYLVIGFLAVCFSLSAQAVEKKREHRVLVLSAAHSNMAKVTLLKGAAEKHDIVVDQRNETDIAEMEAPQALLNQYDLVILSAVSKRFTDQTYAKYAPVVAQLDTKVIAIATPENGQLRKGLSEEAAQYLNRYYDNGGQENFARLARYLQYRVFEQTQQPVAEPIIFPATGIYHPDYDNLIFASREEYENWLASRRSATRGTVGIVLQRALVETAQTDVVDALVHSFEQQGLRVLPFYFEMSPRASDYSTLIQSNGETLVDVIVNLRSIHWANMRKAEFEKFGVPVIQALTYSDGDQTAWEQSPQGIAAGMMAFTLVLPETAGVIDPMVVAAVNQTTHQTEIIDYQLAYLVERAQRYVALKHKANPDKKLTVMFWGDRDMGASFLNVPESLGAISKALSENGYAVKPVDGNYYIDRVGEVLDPFYREYALEDLLAKDFAELFPVARYREWLNTLPADSVKPITEYWGEPEDNFMVVNRNGEKYFVIPRIRNGNMLVMRQPPRGDDPNQEQALYHTTTVPVNHYYLAAYLYARDVWQSDAFIHLGTHGSLEFLPGKERGLSRFDPGPLALGAVPVMYPYIVDDVGEAMQAKRRGSAVIVSHMTPPFASAGLQGITADINQLMHQYKTLDEGGVKAKTAEQIARICVEKNLCKDIGWDQAKIDGDFDRFIQVLHEYIEEIATENQPLGLHTLGELPEPRLINTTIVQMLGSEFIAAAAQFEKAAYPLAEALQKTDGRGEHHGGAEPNVQALTGVQTSDTPVENLPGFQFVSHLVTGNETIEDLDDALKAFALQGRKYYQNITNIREMDNLLAGLSGQYIPANTGGDPIRHPESLPSGLNLYGFDPSRLPTQAAFAQGKELVEDVINTYHQEHGVYPDKLAFSLWSIEAMRHYGVLESQALYAMGVEPVWSADGRVIDTKIIPASELKRPRVDVVLSATGLYRDAFPSVMQRLAKAVQQVAELKEEGNSLWQNSQRVKQELIAEGMDEAEAQYLSTVRIFSNASGDYGSGVDGPVFNSDTWESDDIIADNYLARMGYYFGADDSRWGQRIDGLYGKQLSGTDAALFARSSNLYGMITSDDPFEFFGSLALAVRTLDGKSPDMLISNLRSVSQSKMEKASTFLAKELRTRNFNKRWIREMQKEGYSGATTMASNLANFWGWQVVDPNTVRADQWQDFFEIYIEDRLDLNMDEFFEQANPQAQAQMIERMLESIRKDYWPASDSVQQTLIERYQELVNEFDLVVDNEKLREFISDKAVGYGLDVTLPALESPANAIDVSNTVEGQQLKKQETAQSTEPDNLRLLLLALGCLLIIILGGAKQLLSPVVQIKRAGL